VEAAQSLQRTGNKRQVVLAASALADAAAEPASDDEGSPMEAPAPVVAVEQGDGARLRASEAAESAARSLMAGHPQMEIAQMQRLPPKKAHQQ